MGENDSFSVLKYKRLNSYLNYWLERHVYKIFLKGAAMRMGHSEQQLGLSFFVCV